MPPREPSDDHDRDDRDAVVVVKTGRAGQHLICEGWLASHADSGTPGPHVHLRTSDGEPPVLRTDQLASLIGALTTVAGRVDRLWETDGDRYAADVVLRAPDPQDPRVAQERALDRLRFTQAVLDNLPDVMRLLTEATSTDEALVGVAALLGVDEAEVMVGLARFDLLALTRPATERRLRALADPGSR
jgi:PAS domain-containing protein